MASENDEARDPAELDAPGATLSPHTDAGATARDRTGPASAGEPRVDPEASGGQPDPDGLRRTDMTEMGVPGATGGGPKKLTDPAQADERLARALDAEPTNQAGETDPGLGEPGA